MLGNKTCKGILGLVFEIVFSILFGVGSQKLFFALKN